MVERKLRVGIDVGGTFTHAVALDNRTFKLVAHAVTPTTHSSKDSVSEGIIKVFEDVLKQVDAKAEEVIFVAHSTTQATNALLEGDVEKVGIVGMGSGFDKIKAKSDTAIDDLDLSDGKKLYTESTFIDSQDPNLKEQIEKAIEYLKDNGCEVIVASEAFGVDHPENEILVSNIAKEKNLLATKSHEISQLYGLKVRTRTAVINASILPKMAETANLTNYSIKKSGITAPLMIMRSDGGVMDIDQMKLRPILTLLSGPAAGIAAALMYANVSDGIFLEVGGTSADISAIKNGRAMIKSSQIGGHTTYLKTLDSRTVGIGGGSMVRIAENGKVVDTGPRSAHIAGLKYFAFADESEFNDLKVISISPLKDDPNDYVVLENSKGIKFALTLTDAAMMAKVSKPSDYSYGNMRNVELGFKVLSEHFNVEPVQLAKDILDHACVHIKPVIDSLIEDYEIDPTMTSLVGGGGGSSAIVSYLGEKIDMKYQIAEHAEVISAIGVAMAMLRDMVEKTVINPTPEDIASVRKQVVNSLLEMGADPKSVEVLMEIDKQKNIIRATATGGIEMKNRDFGKPELSNEECLTIASNSMHLDETDVVLVGTTNHLKIFKGTEKINKLFGLIKTTKSHLRILDKYGTVLLQLKDGNCIGIRCDEMMEKGMKYLKDNSSYSDAGQILPEVYIVYCSRIADFSSILSFEDIGSLIEMELEGIEQNEKVYIVTKER